MTVIYSPSLRNLLLGRGVLNNLANTGVGISIYAGVQPTAAEIAANWSLYNSANVNHLVHYVTGIWTQPLEGLLLQLSTKPAAVAPLNSGIATWGLIWATNISVAQLAGASLPSTTFIVVPCSNLTGKGVIRFNDPNLVQGTPVAISDGSIGSVN